MLLAFFIGPSGAGLLLTGVVGGRAGFRQLLARLFAWRVGARWYAAALLIAPLVMAATIFPLALTSPVFLPRIITADDKASLVLGALAVGSLTGFLEELGWTGFAVPRLRMGYGVLATGVIAGFLWGAWHYITACWGSGSPSGEVSLPLFLPTFAFYVAVLPLYRVLMVWVYDRTESLLVAMLMHASLTGTVFNIFMPLDTSEVTLVTWYLVMTAALWLVVVSVAAAHGGQVARGRPRRAAVSHGGSW
jgi:membrane protease YdiL (CAAX protease family)